MTPQEKHTAEVAAALLLLTRKTQHGLFLALYGGAKGLAGRSLDQASSELERLLGRNVEAARGKSQKLASESFAKQTGIPVPLSGKAEGSGYDAAGSLADQWAVKAQAMLDDGLAVDIAYEKAAKDLEWATKRTATTEIFAGFNAETKAAFSELSVKGVGTLVRIWKAELEACPLCSPLHDTEADSFGEFPYGDPLLHVNCRCYTVTAIR